MVINYAGMRPEILGPLSLMVAADVFNVMREIHNIKSDDVSFFVIN